MYRHPSPAQSTTSLSDVDDDDFNKSALFNSDPVAATPAQWSSHLLSPTNSRRSPASALPPEILIHILKYLNTTKDLYSALLVSRAWCECSVELLWHRPSFNKLSTLGKMMRVLARDDQTFLYARFIRRLNFLYLGADLTDSLFSRLAQCVRLERLTLINCNQLTDGALARVLPCCPNLVALDLTGVVETTDRAVVALASSTKKLQGINLGGCKKLTDKGVLALAVNCPLLRRVKLSHVEQVTDDAVSALAKSCPLLLEIDLNNCKNVTDVSVRDLWTHSTNMREMRLSHCVELTDAAFPASPRSEPSLVNGPNPFPTSSFLLGDKPPPLRVPKPFEHLRMLDLTGCANITDEAIEGIISVAPKIRNLVLAKCTQLTDAAVESICALGKHLHYLHLGHASAITDRSITSLARACTRLRYIDLANCVQLTDMSVFELSSLAKLRRIGLVRVSQLTDQAIYALAERHSTMERIHLSYCDQITVMAIHYLLQKLPKLTHLSLTGIPAFRRPELQQFCREAPAEFNSGQRAAFCVYSGKGVSQLREFLTDLFNTITDEMATGSGTEYDEELEDDYRARYRNESVVNETEDDDDDQVLQPPPPAQAPRLPSPPRSAGGLAEQQNQIRFPPRELLMTRDRANQPMARGSSNLSAWPQGHLQQLPAAGPSRAMRGFGQQPIIETSTSPAPSDVASNRSAGTNNSTGTAFFRNYAEGNATAVRQGVMTPDLIFAEIGHGRGTGPHAGPSTIVIPNPTRRPVDPLVIVPPSPSASFVGGTASYTPMTSAAAMAAAATSAGSHQFMIAPSSSGFDSAGSHDRRFDQPGRPFEAGFGDRSQAVPWRSTQAPGLPSSPTTRELHNSVQTVLASTPNGSPGVVVEEGRGRSVKRSLRNTISAAEQYASMIFGRGSGGSGGDGSPGSGGGSGAGAGASTSMDLSP
ncbi:RNI-like protein [Panus rudis PR-1116 ss-1]|nr:RNI-like protein [Panus rudis PR-1116 ss-1]